MRNFYVHDVAKVSGAAYNVPEIRLVGNVWNSSGTKLQFGCYPYVRPVGHPIAYRQTFKATLEPRPPYNGVRDGFGACIGFASFPQVGNDFSQLLLRITL